MKFKVKELGIITGNASVILMDDDDAFLMGIRPGDRVQISSDTCEKSTIAIVDHSTNDEMIKQGEVGLYFEVMEKCKINTNNMSNCEVEIQLAEKPRSFLAIKEKIKGKTLDQHEIDDIIHDATSGGLLPIEIAAFITALQINGLSDEEVIKLTIAMANSGEIMKFDGEVYDKHSTGGVPGNKVTLLIVPIIASQGLFIPKTSTRAITSPSGTADSFEVLANVAFSKEEMLKILETEKVGILWGGAVDSAPADNALIRIEKPLNMDPFPLMIASIICKKMAMGVTKLVLDVPCGKGTKFPTLEHGREYANRFKFIAQSVGIDAICLLTSAVQPIGHAVGPALEAREAMRILKDPHAGPSSLLHKSCELAGILLEMGGISKEGEGKDKAIEILESGEAYTVMKRIIKAQGGDPEVNPETIEVGKFVKHYYAEKKANVTDVENGFVNRIAKIAGCPGAKKAGIEIHKKIGASIKKGDLLFSIYSDSEKLLEKAMAYYETHKPQIMGGMTIEKI